MSRRLIDLRETERPELYILPRPDQDPVPERVPLAVRAWAVPIKPDEDEAAPRRSHFTPPLPRELLVLDCETTTDEVQRLTFGWARFLVPIPGSADRYSLSGFEVTDEWCFHGDDLPQRDPAGFEVLQRHVGHLGEQAGHPVHLLSREEFVNGPFRAIAFGGQVPVVGFNLMFDLPRLAARCGIARARLPRVRNEEGQLSPERFSRFAGGFSLVLFTYRDFEGREREDKFAPRLQLKRLMPGRNLVAFGTPRHDGLDPDDLRPAQRGHFLDAHTLGFALSAQRLTLARSCEVFGVNADEQKLVAEEHGQITPDYVDYGRGDVLATAALTLRELQEFDSHPISPAHVYRNWRSTSRPGKRVGQISLDPIDPRPNRAATLQATKAYSPASIGKAYLEYMRLRPVLERQPDFPPELLGLAMGAFYGGRSEVRIRHQPVPVVLLDFLSMYPTVNALMCNWDLLIAPRIDVAGAMTEVEELLRRVVAEGPAALLNLEPWKLGCTVCEVLPQGERFPVRTTWGAAAGDYGIGVNPLCSDRPLPYMLPDLLAATLLSGRVPEVVSAQHLVPSGPPRPGSLRTTFLGGQVAIHPARQDFFKTVIEQRQLLKERQDLTAAERERLSLFLKILTNATSYGVFAQMDRADLPPRARVPVQVFTGSRSGAFETETAAPETPGRFTFPPIAAAITAGARLMLALAERMITDAGGTYAFMDTDSSAPVANESGGTITCRGGPHRLPTGGEAVRALSFANLEEIRARFESLNPYDRRAVPGSILQVESKCLTEGGNLQSLTCLAVSAKRYVLVDRSGGVIRASVPAAEGEFDEQGVELEPDAVAVVKNSEHGLGGFLNPCPLLDPDRDWIRQFWAAALQSTTGSRLQLPDWQSSPAMHQLSISTAAILRGFDRLNRSRSEADRLRPGTFILAPQITTAPVGIDPTSFRLVGPFERDSARWLERSWRNLHPTRRRDIEDADQVRDRWEVAQLAAEVWGSLRNQVLLLAGGVRPDRDYPARLIPAPVRRRSGQRADEVADELGFEYADDLITALNAAWDARQTSEAQRLRRSEWQVEPPGTEFRISVGELEVEDEHVARVATIGEVLAKYLHHPEGKSLGPDGERCTGYTVGLLRVRPVRAGEVQLIGKEATAFEERAAGIVPNRGATVNEYRAASGHDDLWQLALRVLLEAGREELAREVGTDPRHLLDLIAGRKQPGAGLRTHLLEAAEVRARSDLSETAVQAEQAVARGASRAAQVRDQALTDLFRRWSIWRAASPRRCGGCGQPLLTTDPRQFHHSARCRDAAWRWRKRALEQLGQRQAGPR
ncbi:MAG: hypothetical protein WA724_09705 [Candidatus Dormiibacterota bacterium]